MYQIFTKSGFCSASLRTNSRACWGVSIFTIGGSPRSSFSRETLEMSGPATATRGAFAVAVGLLRAFTFHIAAATMNHAGYAAPNVAREVIVEVRFDPGDFVLVRANVVEIRAIRAREQISGLKEVNVRVDVTRQDKFADATD